MPYILRSIQCILNTFTYLINIIDRWSGNMQGCEFALSHFRSLFIRSIRSLKKSDESDSPVPLFVKSEGRECRL